MDERVRAPARLKIATACFAAAVTAMTVLGCSSTAVFDARLGKAIEARLDTPGPVGCAHETRDLWLCSYEPDPGSNSHAELVVRRRSGDCWEARRSRPTPSRAHPYSRRGLSVGRHEAFGRALRGCA